MPAYTAELKDDVYRIRHQVYCEELAFEPQRPDRREHDDYDEQSLHLLIRSIQTGQFIGCTRIVRVRPDDPDRPLPFEKTCVGTLDLTIVNPSRLPRHSIGEVSRLAVLSQFRKRRSDTKKTELPLSSDSDFGTVTQPRFPYIPIGLYLGTIELARLNNICTLFVLTEQRLASQFKRLGVNIQKIGEPVEHRGARIPSMLDPEDIIKNLTRMIRPLYRVIASEVASKTD